MKIQRIRNLTTGIMHTELSHVFEDIDYITGVEGVMKHMIPNACEALMPYLKEQLQDPRFWDEKHDPKHLGDIDIQPMSERERKAYFERYKKLPNPLEGKEILAIAVTSTGEIA